MRRDLLSGLSQQQRPLLANMLLPTNRILAGLTALDLLRGWSDDFYGDSLDARYNTALNGAGSAVALQDSRHGGVCRLTAGNVAGAYARLFLGDGAAGYSTIHINADLETVMITRCVVVSTGNGQAVFGGYEAGTNNACHAGHIPTVSANWLIWSRDNAGASSSTASTIPVDTNPHWLVFIISSAALTLYVDGALACTHTNNLPSNYLEPYWQTYRETAQTQFDLDCVAVIPRNVA